jgi:osmotically-inducible protein OsmY
MPDDFQRRDDRFRGRDQDIERGYGFGGNRNDWEIERDSRAREVDRIRNADRTYSTRDEGRYGRDYAGERPFRDNRIDQAPADTDHGSGYEGSYRERYAIDQQRGRSFDHGGASRGSGYGRDYPGRGYQGRDSGLYRRGGAYGRGDDRGQERNWWDRATDEVSSWFGDDEAEYRRREDERRQGQHRGRGPRNYARSDDRIREDVSDRLTDDTWIDASEIEVTVSGGEVTLAGFVTGRSDKRRAEDLAESVSGVTHVQNNLRVRSSADGGYAGGTVGSGTAVGSSVGRAGGSTSASSLGSDVAGGASTRAGGTRSRSSN